MWSVFLKKTIYSRSSLPILANYEQVNIFWESIRPIKGWNWSQNVRPLGAKNTTNIFSIKKNKDKSFSCVLKGDDLIKFHANKTIELWTGLHPRCSQVKSFIENILPNFQIKIHKSRILYKCLDGDFQIPQSNQGLILSYDQEKKHYLPINASFISIYKLDRDKFKKVKKLYTEYIEYIISNYEQRKGIYPEEEYEGVFGFVVHRTKWSRMAEELEDIYIEENFCREYWRTDLWKVSDEKKIESFFMLLESKNISDKNKAILLLASESRKWERRNWNCSRMQSLELILKTFENCLLARHKLELLNKIDLPYGQFEIDQYGKFFSN